MTLQTLSLHIPVCPRPYLNSPLLHPLLCLGWRGGVHEVMGGSEFNWPRSSSSSCPPPLPRKAQSHLPHQSLHQLLLLRPLCPRSTLNLNTENKSHGHALPHLPPPPAFIQPHPLSNSPPPSLNTCSVASPPPSQAVPPPPFPDTFSGGLTPRPSLLLLLLLPLLLLLLLTSSQPPHPLAFSSPVLRRGITSVWFSVSSSVLLSVFRSSDFFAGMFSCFSCWVRSSPLQLKEAFSTQEGIKIKSSLHGLRQQLRGLILQCLLIFTGCKPMLFPPPPALFFVWINEGVKRVCVRGERGGGDWSIHISKSFTAIRINNRFFV